MQRLVDKLQLEAEIFGIVIERRPRSLVLLFAALASPLVVKLAFAFFAGQIPVSGLADGLSPLSNVFALVVAFKMGFLAVRTYLRDRAQLLRF